MEATSQTMSSMVTENLNICILPSILALVGGLIYFFTQKTVELTDASNANNSKKIMFRALLASIFIFVCCLSSVYFCSRSMEGLNDIPFLTGAKPPF